VFSAGDPAPDQLPEEREPGLVPVFVPVDRIRELDLRPPLAGHVRRMLSQRRELRGELYAPYLANLWRPARGPASA
jgi:8-oxo-dGTP diphosphatase